MPHLLDMFDRVRIINLVERADRRREMLAQLDRIGGMDARRTAFFPATRPIDAGEFPSKGARGCYESHLAILREARADGVRRLLILEDDLDFSADIEERGAALLDTAAKSEWSFFYGSHRLEPRGRTAVAEVPAEEGIMTTALVAFDQPVIDPLIRFLEEAAARPAGSPDYGPMHVDGAYSVFRALNPAFRTLATFPPIGDQRSSRSDVSDDQIILDRFGVTRPIANLLRRTRDRLRG